MCAPSIFIVCGYEWTLKTCHFPWYSTTRTQISLFRMKRRSRNARRFLRFSSIIAFSRNIKSLCQTFRIALQRFVTECSQTAIVAMRFKRCITVKLFVSSVAEGAGSWQRRILSGFRLLRVLENPWEPLWAWKCVSKVFNVFGSSRVHPGTLNSVFTRSWLNVLQEKNKTSTFFFFLFYLIYFNLTRLKNIIPYKAIDIPRF